MRKVEINDEEVMAEIERLKDSPNVRLAQREIAKGERNKNPLRKKLYQLRWLEKRGKELSGVEVKNG